jgi:hypothetical protein
MLMSLGENSRGGTALVRCAYCAGRVTLQLSEPKPSESRIPGRWNCPYCQQDNTGSYVGRLAWVRKGHEE